MTRRRIILATLFLLLATFVVAVQHDTFIRRWCLPTPPPATRAAGPLDQVIDEFVVDDAHPEKVARALERRAGVRLGADNISRLFAVGRPTGRSWRPACTIRQATLGQLLARIFAPITPFSFLDDDTIPIGVDGTLDLRPRPPSTRHTAIRVHDVDPTLLRSDLQWTGLPFTWGTAGNDPIRKVQFLTLHHVTSSRGQTDPVLRFGDKLIVLTTPRNHWLIDQYLREETEAQHAIRNHPAATRPAQ